MIWHKNFIPPTREEKSRNDRVMKLGCLLSKLRAEKGLPVPRGKLELDHLVSPGKRCGHAYTICLHSWYHRGIVPYPCASRVEARELYGATITHGSKAFLESHGVTRWMLWEMTQQALGLSTERPQTKVMERRIAC